MIMPTRRHVTLGLSALALTPLPALASAEGFFVEDVVVGSEDAPVTVYEYVSYTCGFCARFHRDIWPRIKEAYVDTGKAKFVVRGFYRNTVDLDIDVMSRCGGAEAYYPVADAFLNTHSDWTTAGDINAAIRQVARRTGMPQARMEECLASMDFKRALVERFRENAATHDVNSTPTFVVGNTIHRGLISFEDMSALLDEALT